MCDGCSSAKVSVDEYLEKYSVNDECCKYEIYNDRLVKNPGPSPEHQELLGTMQYTLYGYFKDTKCKVLQETPVKFTIRNSNITNIFKPDLLVICSDFTRGLGYIDGVPELIIEVWSHPNRIADLDFKLDVYRDAGVKEYIQIFQGSKMIIAQDLRDRNSIKVYPLGSPFESIFFKDLKFDLSKFDASNDQ